MSKQAWWIAGLAVLLAASMIAGCASNATLWTVTDVQADHGRDTMEDEVGLMYHNYYLAVVLKRNTETVNLIYVNQLPDHVDLAVGDTVELRGLMDATYSETWNGYWLHDVTLVPGPVGGPPSNREEPE